MSASEASGGAGASSEAALGARASAPEIWFFHVVRGTALEVLPKVLERALARSWRSVVQLGDAARVAVVDDYLWTFRDDSFLPHARAGEGEATHQPVWLTDGDDNPNGAALRVLMDGVDPAAAAHDPCYQRVLILFDGQDESLVAQARQAWQGLRETAAGELSYWQQDEDGQFQKKYSRAARDSGGTAGPAAAPATDIDTGDMT